MSKERTPPRARHLTLPKRVFFRALLAGLVLLATLLLVEGVLQVASRFVGQRTIALGGDGAESVVLCLGDSNTYGVFYPQDQAYPAQLQDVLDRRAPGGYRTLNLGLPGMSSAQIRTRLAGWLETYRPRYAVVGVGINNYWNRSDTDPAVEGSLLSRVRTYRLLRLLMTEAAPVPENARPEIEWVLPNGGLTHNQQLDAETGELLIEHRGNWKDWNRSHEDVAAELRADLDAIRRLTDRHGVELVVMTYAAFPLPGRPPRYLKQENVNATLRAWSAERGVTLVDLTERFTSLLPVGTPRVTLFASEKESHANPIGYREVAQLVADAIHPGETQVRPLLEGFDEALIEREAVDYVQVARNRITIGRDEREAMFQHPTTTVTFTDVPIAPRSRLAFAIALREDAWSRAGDGVTFVVELAAASDGSSEVFRRYIDPKHREEDRRWLEESVDLAAWAGQRVAISFRTSPGPAGNSYFDWSAWAEPRLLSEVVEPSS